MLTEMGKVVRRELTAFCSDKAASVLQKSTRTDLMEFTWEKLLLEAQIFAPSLLKILCTALRLDKGTDKRSVSTVGMIISILCCF